MSNERMAFAAVIAAGSVTAVSWTVEPSSLLTTVLSGACGVALVAWVTERVEAREDRRKRLLLERRITQITEEVLAFLDSGVDLDRVPEFGCAREFGATTAERYAVTRMAAGVQSGLAPGAAMGARKALVRKALKV